MSTTRGQILEATLARLEAERFAAPRRPEYKPAPPPRLTDAEALDNARRLLEATSDDPVVAEWANGGDT